jgi:hypothetical protein
MTRQIKTQMQQLCFFSAAVCLLCFCVERVKAQDPLVQHSSAPPPAKLITKDDRARIDAAKDDKARLRTTIELAEGHLTDAETKSQAEEFDLASASLGKYHAMIEEALRSLGAMKQDQNRTRDLYKRLELALRAHGPRLTAIRRSTPLEYAVWVKQIEEYARKGRTEALNSFYGNTVLKEPQSKVETDKRPKNEKNSSPLPND